MSKTGRRSGYINRRVTQEIFRAFDYAIYINRPLTHYVVINFRTSAASPVALFELVRRKFTNHLRYLRARRSTHAADFEPTYVYAFENCDDLTHVNWVVHVPHDIQGQFDKNIRRWIARVLRNDEPYDIHIEPVAQPYAKRLAKYILKGTDPAFVSHFHLEAVHEPQGEIWGKRAGISPSLGRSARDKAGYQPRRGRAHRFQRFYDSAEGARL